MSAPPPPQPWQQEPQVNAKFGSIGHLRLAVGLHAAKNGKHYRVLGGRKTSWQAICITSIAPKKQSDVPPPPSTTEAPRQCPFSVHAQLRFSREGDGTEPFWLVEKADLRHTCTEEVIKQAVQKRGTKKARYVAKDLAPFVMEMVRNDRRTRPSRIMTELEPLFVDVPDRLARRVRDYCVEKLDGKSKLSFTKLKLFLERFKRADEDNFAQFVTKPLIDSKSEQFVRAFVGIGASKRTEPHLLPVFTLSGFGCLSECKGVLFSLGGVDPNFQTVDLAFGYACGELADDWSWFLLQCKAFLGPDVLKKKVVVLRGDQKTPENVRSALLGDSTPAVFTKDVADNVLRRHGEFMTPFFWELARVLSPVKFDSLLRKAPEALKRYLADTKVCPPKEQWSRAFFAEPHFGLVGCKETIGGGAISGNEFKLHPSDMLHTLVSTTHDRLMERLEAMQKAKTENRVVPWSVERKLAANTQLGKTLVVRVRLQAGRRIAGEVDNEKPTKVTHSVKADPKDKSFDCSCGAVRTFRLPCEHVCAFAAACKHDISLFVPPLMHWSAFCAAYTAVCTVNAVGTADIAEEAEAHGEIFAPTVLRPMRKRRLRASNRQTKRQCRRCGLPGHYTKTCLARAQLAEEARRAQQSTTVAAAEVKADV